MFVWLSVWSEVQIVCMWSSWFYCHPKTPSTLASFESRPVLPFWYWLVQVVLEKRPLNGCSSVVVVFLQTLLCVVLSFVIVMIAADFISDVAMARRGYPRTGISACYGGPLFSILAHTNTQIPWGNFPVLPSLLCIEFSPINDHIIRKRVRWLMEFVAVLNTVEKV